MSNLSLTLGLWFLFLHTVIAQNVTWQTTPFNPPQFPLVVKSPYTSAWATGANVELSRPWPHFGTTGDVLGWTCYVKVDNLTYIVIGAPGADSTVNQTSTQFTATQTVIMSRAGPVDLTVTFLSSLDYADLVRLSLPFSYISVSAATNDGRAHTVMVYMDISGEWITGDNNQAAQWSTVTDNGVVLHKMFLQSPASYVESRQRAQWGTVYLASNQTTGTTFQTGPATVLREQFLASGVLSNSQDTKFRGVSDNWPILAICQNLGNISTQPGVATFVLGHTRNPAVRYITPSGQEDRSLYFLSKFATEEDA
ncbi:hypothetical protein FRC08_010964, partial [Ceratobasidium sp. 394]